jgi:hypothetical protein
VKPRPRERAWRTCFAPSRSVGENQIRGGGIGGRSIRAEAVASPVEKTWPSKRGIGNGFAVGQKRMSVEHEDVQQLRCWDRSVAHPLCDREVCSTAILHVCALEQQTVGFGAVITFALPTAGHRNVKRQTISKATMPALRMGERKARRH